MLNLQGMLLGRIEIFEEQKEIIVPCRSARLTARCPMCNSNPKKVHQIKIRRIKHGLLNYRQVILQLRVRRFKPIYSKLPSISQFPQ